MAYSLSKQRPSTNTDLRAIHDDLTGLQLKSESATEALETGYLSEPELCGAPGGLTNLSDGPYSDDLDLPTQAPHLPDPVLEIIAGYVLVRSRGVMRILPSHVLRQRQCQLSSNRKSTLIVDL